MKKQTIEAKKKCIECYFDDGNLICKPLQNEECSTISKCMWKPKIEPTTTDLEAILNKFGNDLLKIGCTNALSSNVVAKLADKYNKKYLIKIKSK